MAPSSLTAALHQRPVAYLRSSWPLRAAAWSLQAGVAGGLVIGLGAAVLAPPLNGTWLLTTWSGILLEALMVALFVAACVVAAAGQRRAVTLIRRSPVISPYRLSPGRAAPAGERVSRLADVLHDGALPRDIAFAVLFAPIGALAGLATLLVPPIAVGATAAIVLAIFDSPLAQDQDSSTWVTTGIGLALFVALPWLIGFLAAAGCRLAQAVMDPGSDRARAQAAAIATSRRRLAGAFDAERRRLERDLHDGAQQLIVAQAMTLGLAAAELREAQRPAAGVESQNADACHLEAARALVDKASTENRRILEQLRDLVRRVHPQVLTDRGLAAALAEVVGRSPLPVDSRIEIGARPPALLESTAYFVVLEGLTNAAKHAPGSALRLRVATLDDALSVSLADDGPGGAELTPGGGLTGLAERVAAVGGTFQISSQHGEGTMLRADFPYSVAARTEVADETVGAGLATNSRAARFEPADPPAAASEHAGEAAAGSEGRGDKVADR